MLNLVFAIGCSPNIEQMKTQEDDVIEIQDSGDLGSYSLRVGTRNTKVSLQERMFLIPFRLRIQWERLSMILLGN